ncbi:MAG: L-fucose mutarotase [Alkalispirochaeta sp.]
MLHGISPILSPELLKIVAEMGHGDELVIGDGNFPAASMSQRLVRADGHGVAAILEGLLPLFPLDRFVAQPAALMQVVAGDDTQPTIWEDYRAVIQKYQPERITEGFEMVERFAFYERTRSAYAVVATGETALYANIILKKGVVE